MAYRLFLLFLTHIMMLASGIEANAQLKYVVYDFEGYDLNQTDLPEADYRYGDVTYKVTSNPAGAGLMISNRVLQVNWNSATGNGGFGRDFSSGANATKFTDLSRSSDFINFYILNPTANSKNLNLDIYIQDDDNYDNSYQAANDDDWMASISITRTNNWQLISIPLLSFTDQNSGGDGVFNIGYSTGTTFTGIQFRPTNLTSSDPVQQYHFDMICFSEGVLPTGATTLDAPVKSASDFCLLGAFTDLTAQGYNMSKIPQMFEGKLNPPGSRKLCITNYFVEWSYDGSNTPNNFVNVAWANSLLGSGYVPMITWEPWYTNLAYNNPTQPSLTKINAGNYDAYINSFADQMKTVSGTVVIRLMHEMNGDWYPWSIPTNGANNTAHTSYINAWRKIVNMFSARGVTNVKWVWCVNAEAVPFDMAYNNFVNSYPGDAYVDMVGFDVYNHPATASLPYWRSFRFETASVYYSLGKNFPSKPIYICEIGSRERYFGHPTYGTEDATSETKAQWITVLDKELESNFSKVRALVWFDINKEHDWRINSSSSTLNAFQTSIWSNSYYTGCSTSLPLGFISVKVAYTGNLPTINFQVNETGNIQHYIIQSSYDGLIFNTIATIPSSGNIGIINYSWQDIAGTNGNEYYRVIQVDKDNQTFISSVLYIELVTDNLYSIFPNPGPGIFTIKSSRKLKNQTQERLEIFIYDISGRLIENLSVIENQTIELNKELIHGTFILRVISDQSSEYFILIINETS